MPIPRRNQRPVKTTELYRLNIRNALQKEPLEICKCVKYECKRRLDLKANKKPQKRNFRINLIQLWFSLKFRLKIVNETIEHLKITKEEAIKQLNERSQQ